MTANVPTARSTRSAQSSTAGKKPTIADITSAGSNLPRRYILHAPEKFGKTSFAAQTPKPIFIQSRGETGLDPLIDSGQINPTAHFPEANGWLEFLGCVDALLTEDHDMKTAVIDTINGAERLCHEFICARDFGNDWGDKGFASYQKGPEVALSEWRSFLGMLDRLRVERRMTIFGLCHTKVANYKNPCGPDYDRYQPDMDRRTWALTAKWSDVILFGNFEDSVTAIKENKKTGEQKGKGVGGRDRILYTEKTAAYDAGNRIGLPGEIEMGNSPQEGWAKFLVALKKGRGEVVANG
jgi:hypothetical protein